MADVTPTISPFSAVELGAGIRGGGLKVVWSGLTENDTALPWDGGVMFPNKSAHIEGLTFVFIIKYIYKLNYNSII